MNPNDVHRMSELLGARVLRAGGQEIGRITDVRLAPSGKTKGFQAELVVDGCVVSPGRSLGMLGYDRHPHQGPWLIRTLVRWVHRGACFVPYLPDSDITWGANGSVVVDERMAPSELHSAE